MSETKKLRYVHGCWLTGANRVCEDGTKGCARRHPLTEAPEPTPEPTQRHTEEP